jgi:hypothetical protein
MDRNSAHDDGLELEPDSALNDKLPSATDRLPAQAPGLPSVGRPRLRLISAPSAIAGALLVTTIVFGAAGIPPASIGESEMDAGSKADAVEPATDTATSALVDAPKDEPRPAGDDWMDEWWVVDEPKDEPKDERSDEPKGDPKEEPKEEPKDGPTPTPKPKPSVQELGLTLGKGDGKVKVDWTTCRSDAFASYKVVRSPDSTVTWPAGENDKVVGVIKSRTKTAMVDTSFPHGKKVWYRVFCIADGEHDNMVLGRTTAKSIVTPKAESAPEPYVLGFELDFTDDGVVLNWEKCGSDGFAYYKVVRSATENPSYLPWTDGSEVIAVIENGGLTTFTDTDVEAGDHWFYRVQSIGIWDGQKVVLGETPVREVSLD